MDRTEAIVTECPWCAGEGCLACARTSDGSSERRRRETIRLALTEITGLAVELESYVGDLTVSELEAIGSARNALAAIAAEVGTCPACGRGRAVTRHCEQEE